MRSRDLPRFAAEALSHDIDSQALRVLAGLSTADTVVAGELFERAIHELGWAIPDKRSAALRYAVCVSRLILSGEVAPSAGAKALWDASLAVEDSAFHELDPLSMRAASTTTVQPTVRCLTKPFSKRHDAGRLLDSSRPDFLNRVVEVDTHGGSTDAAGRPHGLIDALGHPRRSR